MSLIISQIYSKRSNVIYGYERFRYTKQYIKCLSPISNTHYKLSVSDKKLLLEMAKSCGFSDIEKFLQQKKVWDEIRGEIPIAYFQYLGVDQKILNFMLELDNEDYERILQQPSQKLLLEMD